MSKRDSRVWTPFAVILAAAALGTALGYGAGLGVSLYNVKNALRKYIAYRSTTSQRYPAEGYEVLAQMNASTNGRCSDGEMAAFRRLVLAAHYVKDAGRMRGDQLECSSTLNRADLPGTHYEPAFTGAGGALIYIKMEALRIGKLTPIVMRMGDAYVALDPYPREMTPPTVHFTITSTNAPAGKPNYLGGDHTSITGDALTKNGYGSTGGYLYATDCMSRYMGCNTAFISTRNAFVEERQTIKISSAAGAAAGACFGLVGLLFYRRKKGIEQQLRRAIRRNALRVVYQPLVDLRTRKVTGAEALVRWTDEDHLVIPPDVFIKIAEQRGFVDQITKLVVRRVLADFGEFLAAQPDFRINVNVSASDLTDPDFQAALEDALWEARVSPRALGIEITEGATAQHEQAVKAIAHLRHRGHRVYIDDFGTGYSSLAYLKDLAVDGIKIDRAFTHAIGTESVTVGILPQIISMAEALKLKVVAEGVETEAQYAYYDAMALSLTGQGWLFGYPLPPEEFRKQWMEPVSESFVPADLAWAPRVRPRKDGPPEAPAAKVPVLAGRGMS